MEFSKKYLLSYGWLEGEGLGKTKSGIKDAIKPKLKFDKAGMGYDPSLEFTDRWWEKLYNDALDNIEPAQEKDKLLRSKKIVQENEYVEYYDSTNKKRKGDIDLFESDLLYKACKGRTAHKGARHGLKLGGKLKRLEQQEQTLLRQSESERPREHHSHKKSKKNKCRKMQ